MKMKINKAFSLFLALVTSALFGQSSQAAIGEFQEFLRQHPDASAKEVCLSLRRNIEKAPDLFAEASVDQPPKGDTYGCVIGVEILSKFESRLAAMAMNKLWTGKKFNDDGTELVNKIPALKPIGKDETATAKVYRTQSMVDGRDIYVLDYSESEQNFPVEKHLIRMVRDEIREISPGIYLGPVLLQIKGMAAPTTLYFAVFTSKSGLH